MTFKIKDLPVLERPRERLSSIGVEEVILNLVCIEIFVNQQPKNSQRVAVPNLYKAIFLFDQIV